MQHHMLLEADSNRYEPENPGSAYQGRARGTVNLLSNAHGSNVGASLFEQANDLQVSGRFDEAEKLYDQLLTQNPDNGGLLATLGTLYIRTGKYGLAISLLLLASQKLKQSDVYCNLAIAYKYSGQYAKAHEYFGIACSCNPSAEALTNYAGMHVNIAQPDKGIELAKRAIKIEPDKAMAHWNLAICLLEKGDWARGWAEYEWGFKCDMRKRRALNDKPDWDGTNGKRIVVYGEQGMGDEIMFASMLPDLIAAGNDVILENHPRLKTLFQKAWPDMTIHGTRDKSIIEWPQTTEFDYTVSIGSLGKWYRQKREDFHGTPYLKADPLPRNGRFRVGISWIGGMKEGRVRARSVPLAWWTPILDAQDVEFVSLQYTDSDDDIDAVNRMGYDIKKAPQAKAHDYYEAARLVASCDLVISCCTSVIHLAGALGVPTWVMVPNKPAWRYGVSGGMPWYRSVRLYRQPQGDVHAWRPVIARIGADFRERLVQK